MALRRQLGAHSVDLSGDDGYARYWLAQPRELDYFLMDDAADSAGYTITKIELVLEGTTSSASCELCGHEVTILTIPETGQQFELASELSPGATIRVHGEVLDWAGEHPRLTLIK